MENIAWIYRSKKKNEHSIENCFDFIESYVDDSFQISKYFLPEYRWAKPSTWIKNVLYSRQIKGQVLQITGEVYYLSYFIKKKRLVLTIQDFVGLRNYKGLKKLLTHLFFYGLPLRLCRYVVCISESVYEEALQRYPFCKGKIKYIPVPLNDMYDFKEKEFNSECPTLLMIGTAYNKNVIRVITAIKDINCKLKLIGKLSGEQIELLKQYNINYVNRFNVSNEEIYDAYCECDIVCFPSEFEGFGMPIIEGQVIGKPVLTSNISPMKDVAGNAACLVDPFDVNSIREGICKIISDNKYRQELIKKGIVNAEKYRAEYVGKMYSEIYKKILTEDKIL